MNAAPAFQFYAADFLVGVMGLTEEDVGIYMKMLAFQWVKGGLPADPKAVKNIIGSKRIPSPEVMDKFPVCEDGKIRNARLEKERDKQEKFRSTRAANANKRWDKDSTSNARASRVHNGSTCKTDALQSSSSSSPSGVSSKEDRGKATLPQIVEFSSALGLPATDAEYLFDHFEESGWMRGKSPVKDWKATIRKWHREKWFPSQKANQSRKPNAYNEHPELPGE